MYLPNLKSVASPVREIIVTGLLVFGMGVANCANLNTRKLRIDNVRSRSH